MARRLSLAICSAFLLGILGASAASAHGPEEHIVPFMSKAGAGMSSGDYNPALQVRHPQPLPMKPARKISFDTDEGTWMSLDISPDGKQIAFDMLGDIYTLDAKGGKARPITRGLPFDAQPTYSPDGHLIAFVTDRSGAENIWTVRPDGSGLRQLTFRDDNSVLTSPAWSADGHDIYVSLFRADLNAYALWRFAADGSGAGEKVIPIKKAEKDDVHSAIGVASSPDGKYLYYAAHTGRLEFEEPPVWTIQRRNLASGKDEPVISVPGGAGPALTVGTYFRPVISPDGKALVYGTRFDGKTGLRLHDLVTGTDRWLAWPVQYDQLQASHWRDILPRYTFTPDSKSLIMTKDGKITRLDIKTGDQTAIPFKAHVAVDVGPYLRVNIKQETGPVRARLIQTPEQSPDGRQLVFSALGHIYLMALAPEAIPHRLDQSDAPAFNPSWSPDGHWVTYVTWTAKDAGQIWLAAADGSARPRQLTREPAFYTRPVFTPDGKSVMALKSSNTVRMHTYMEYGPFRQAELISLQVIDGREKVIYQGAIGDRPQFTNDSAHVFLNSPAGLMAISLKDGTARKVMNVVGPGWYFQEAPAEVDDLRISPDGKWALVLIAQQLFLVEVPTDPDQVINLNDPSVRWRKLTRVGADFFEWADGGKTITWAVGSSFYRRPLAGIRINPAHGGDDRADMPGVGKAGIEGYEAVVTVPRDVPKGILVLRGGTAITMHGDEVIQNADIVIVDNKIAAVGPRGKVRIPEGAIIRDIGGTYVVPGFIDNHDHIADIRRGILDMKSWGPAANLAYGVTTGFDPSTLSIDMLAYEDLVDAGMMLGSRIHSTGMALFSFNQFKSRDQVKAVLTRYRDHYRTRNLKLYRTGNRRVREWVAMASHDLGMMPTTEGALAMKLDLSQILDGVAGNEHALTAMPLYRDVVELVARSRVSYTLTLMITNGGAPGQDYYISRNNPLDDAKLNRFWPRYVIMKKMGERTWRAPQLYTFPQIAEGAAKVARAGGLLGMGSHGEEPGIGFHWEMQAYASGGMTPHEVLRAATMGAAETIGRQAEFGSLEAGKYADLVILNRNPLKDIANTLSIRQVMKNGRLYDGDTLDELWPRQRKAERPWFLDDRPTSVN